MEEKNYRVLRIEEQLYGCEELPEGQPVLCDVLLEAADGTQRVLPYPDAELTRLGLAMGCKPETFAGLSGMGDLIVTCTSMHSRNLHAGMLIGRGKSVEEAKTEVGQVVEGINALPAACRLAKQYKVEMPIVQAVEAILDGKLEARSALMALMGRSLKRE